jgi:hypothetical protein
MGKYDAKWRATWDKKRRDKGLADKSPSGYSLSIANTLVRAGWSDQDICDALVTWRKKHGEDLKLDRRDWYARTIARAREGLQNEGRIEVDQEVLDDPKSTHEERFDAVNRMLGPIDVFDLRRYPVENPYYEISFTVDKGPEQAVRLDATLGSPAWFDDTLGQRIFRSVLADKSRVKPPKLTPAQWLQVAANLLLLTVNVDIGDGTAGGELVVALEKYLYQNPPSERTDEVLREKVPILLSDTAAFHAGELWAYAKRGDLPMPKRPLVALRQAGLVNKTIAYAGTSTSYWILPSDMWARMEVPPEPATL